MKLILSADSFPQDGTCLKRACPRPPTTPAVTSPPYLPGSLPGGFIPPQIPAAAAAAAPGPSDDGNYVALVDHAVCIMSIIYM